MSRWKWALIAVAVVLVGVIAWRLIAHREAAGGGMGMRGGPGGGNDAPVPVTVYHLPPATQVASVLPKRYTVVLPA